VIVAIFRTSNKGILRRQTIRINCYKFASNKNKREGERHLSNCEAFGINDPYPPRGPFLVED
jgi:hypothetical protein